MSEVFGGGGRISDFLAQTDWASKLGALDAVAMVTLLDVTSFVLVISSTEPSVYCLFRDLVVRVVIVELSIASLVGADDDEILLASRLDSRHFLFDDVAGSWVEGGLLLRSFKARGECLCKFFCGEVDDWTPYVEEGSSACFWNGCNRGCGIPYGSSELGAGCCSFLPMPYDEDERSPELWICWR
jgi:hypothetical protein